MSPLEFASLGLEARRDAGRIADATRRLVRFGRLAGVRSPMRRALPVLFPSMDASPEPALMLSLLPLYLGLS